MKQQSANHRINFKVAKECGGNEIQYSLRTTAQGDGQYWLAALNGFGDIIVSKAFYDSVKVGDYLTFTVERQSGRK